MSLKMRAAPVMASAIRVEGNTLYGVAVAQAVEALGHDMMLDIVSLQQIVDLGNRATKGVKSRFTHPGLSSDGLGKFLGRLRNFRLDRSSSIPTARADLAISEISKKSPDGDLGTYIMRLAEDDPSSFGMSVVISVDPVWSLSDGSEMPVYDENGRSTKRPENSLYPYPVARVLELHASDVVDEPAATREGIFSAFSGTTNQLSAALYQQIDDALTFYRVSPARAYEFVMRYFEARGVRGQAFSMPHTITGEGLRRLSHHMEETVEEFEQEEEVLSVTPPDLSMFSSLIDEVAGAVIAQLSESEIGTVLDRVYAIEQAVEKLTTQVGLIGMAVASLRGEPTVTAKMSGEQTVRSERPHTLSASIPANLSRPPAESPDWKKPSSLRFGSDATENALRMAELRNRGRS